MCWLRDGSTHISWNIRFYHEGGGVASSLGLFYIYSGNGKTIAREVLKYYLTKQYSKSSNRINKKKKLCKRNLRRVWDFPEKLRFSVEKTFKRSNEPLHFFIRQHFSVQYRFRESLLIRFLKTLKGMCSHKRFLYNFSNLNNLVESSLKLYIAFKHLGNSRWEIVHRRREIIEGKIL